MSHAPWWLPLRRLGCAVAQFDDVSIFSIGSAWGGGTGVVRNQATPHTSLLPVKSARRSLPLTVTAALAARVLSLPAGVASHRLPGIDSQARVSAAGVVLASTALLTREISDDAADT